MINWTAMTDAQILLFALVFLRMIAFIVSSAVLGAPAINVSVKVLLSVVLSLVVYPVVRIGHVDYLVISNEIIGLAIRELAIGLVLGFLTRIFFFVVTMTGDFVSMSVGLSASQMYNPLMGSNGNSIDQFYSTIGTLIFFSINGHHMLITAICESFQIVPVSSLTFNVGPLGEMAAFGQTTLLLTIKMCAPVLISIFITNLAMGILGRAVPQINVLVTSMPVTIMIGMSVVFICLPLLVMEMHGLVDITADQLFAVMKHI